jgi:hypothetical protein
MFKFIGGAPFLIKFKILSRLAMLLCALTVRISYFAPWLPAERMVRYVIGLICAECLKIVQIADGCLRMVVTRCKHSVPRALR